MTVPIVAFERLARHAGVVPTTLKHQNVHGTVRFAEGYHHADPEHTINGVIQPGWKTMWFMDRDGADYYGVLWFLPGDTQSARFMAAKTIAEQFIQDNLQVGRYK